MKEFKLVALEKNGFENLDVNFRTFLTFSVGQKWGAKTYAITV